MLAVNGLPDWVDESYLWRLFAPTRSVLSIKMSRLRCTGGGRVAIMAMNSRENAAGCLRAYNNTMPPNTNLRLDIAWASETQLTFEGMYSICPPPMSALRLQQPEKCCMQLVFGIPKQPAVKVMYPLNLRAACWSSGSVDTARKAAHELLVSSSLTSAADQSVPAERCRLQLRPPLVCTASGESATAYSACLASLQSTGFCIV